MEDTFEPGTYQSYDVNSASIIKLEEMNEAVYFSTALVPVYTLAPVE